MPANVCSTQSLLSDAANHADGIVRPATARGGGGIDTFGRPAIRSHACGGTAAARHRSAARALRPLYARSAADSHRARREFGQLASNATIDFSGAWRGHSRASIINRRSPCPHPPPPTLTFREVSDEDKLFIDGSGAMSQRSARHLASRAGTLDGRAWQSRPPLRP